MRRFFTLAFEIGVAFTAFFVLPAQSRDAALTAQIHSAGGRMVTAINDMTVTIDSVSYRPDLTRVYATMKGHPNRAQRIDDIIFRYGHKSIEATDIDGVDFRRWFQWDDTGIINLEIDFPAIPDNKKIAKKLIFDTPKGEYTVDFK